MKKPKITEGEWISGENKYLKRIIVNDSGEHIVTVYSSIEDFKAITAVPEMIDALIDSYEAVKSLPRDCMGNGSDTHGEYPIRDEVLHTIEQALKKAGCHE